MKKVAGVIILFLLASCLPEPYIEVEGITIDPPGGYGVEKLTAYIYASASGYNRVRVEWKWHGYGSYDEEVEKTEYITIDEDGTYYSIYSATPGYVLLNYYWVELYDKDGYLLKKSNEVYCYYD